MSKKTHTNPLSRHEVELLRNNPHVRSITTHTLSFTEEFKQLVYEEKRKGIPVAETLRKHGINL